MTKYEDKYQETLVALKEAPATLTRDELCAAFGHVKSDQMQPVLDGINSPVEFSAPSDKPKELLWVFRVTPPGREDDKYRVEFVREGRPEDLESEPALYFFPQSHCRDEAWLAKNIVEVRFLGVSEDLRGDKRPKD